MTTLAEAICKGLGIQITQAAAEPIFANEPFIAKALAAAGYHLVNAEGLARALAKCGISDGDGDPMPDVAAAILAALALIVRAVNAHDDLVAALRALVKWDEGEGAEGEGEGCHWCLFSTNHEDGCPVGEARALLRQIDGTTDG